MAFPADSPLTSTAVAAAVISMSLASLVWWRRLARLERIRRQASAIRELSLQVLQAREPDAAALIREKLSSVLGPVHVAVARAPAGEAAPPPEPASLTPGAVPPSPTLVLPLLSEDRALGLLRIEAEQTGKLPSDVRVALADLAGHLAIGLEIQDQKHLKEHMARSEQLAATGLLLSSIATELRPSLLAIAREAHGRALPALASEAGRALDLVERLASYGRPELARVTTFDFNEAVGRLCEFRARAWKLLQIEPHLELASAPLTVHAPRGLLEQAVLSLLVLAEQSLEHSAGPRRIDVSAEEYSGHVTLSIAFPAPAASASAAGVGAARSLIESCGGAFREQQRPASSRFEVELKLAQDPVASAPRPAAAAPPRSLTLLLVHPSTEALREMILALAARQHRVVPASSAGQALEMAARFRFDAIFAFPGLPEVDWGAFSARARRLSPVVGWLTTSSHPAPEGIAALRLGADDAELDAVLATVAETS